MNDGTQPEYGLIKTKMAIPRIFSIQGWYCGGPKLSSEIPNFGDWSILYLPFISSLDNGRSTINDEAY
jgi:hypothetical protein